MMGAKGVVESRRWGFKCGGVMGSRGDGGQRGSEGQGSR